MRQILKALALAALLLPGIAGAQTPQFPQSLPANSVWGRLGVNAGPPQAIPFAVLSSRLTGAAITLNSGNGQTAPGAMSGGNTYSFGANTDTPRFAGIGLGGAAPATGLEVYNAAVTPTGNGQGMVGASSLNGGMLIGQGSIYDAAIGNKSSAIALGVTTGTQNVVLGGTLTAASLATAGTIAGSLCATSAGLILYEAGVNCYAVSGITVVSGKTLTVDNTLEFAGTDGTKFTFPGATDTVATLGANQTVTGNKTFSGTVNITGTGQINGTAFGTFATQNFATPPAIGGTTPNTGAFSTLTATTPVGLTSGGTNASTAAAARASGGLNIDQLTSRGDSSYTILATDRRVGTSSAFTAARTWTLPAASAVNAGQELIVADYVGGVSNTNSLTIQRAGSDTVNGSTSVTINVTNGAYLFISDGVSRWSAQALGAAATVGVSSVNGQTGSVNVVAGAGTNVSTSGGNVTVASTQSLNGQVGALTLWGPPQGRLTLSTGVAVMTSTVSAATTVYYTPSVGSLVPIYDGTNMVPTVFTEISQLTTDTTKSPAAATTNSNYDVFVWNDSGTVRATRGPAYSSNTSRGTGAGTSELVLVKGLYLNANAITNGPAAQRGTYVGTIRTNGSSQVDYSVGGSASGGTAGSLGVWNMYNRNFTTATVVDSGVSYTYGTGTVRQARASAGNQISVLVGLPVDSILVNYSTRVDTAATSGGFGYIGIGEDSTSSLYSQRVFARTVAAVVMINSPYLSISKTPLLGYHTYAGLESGDGSTTSTFDGDGTATLVLSVWN